MIIPLLAWLLCCVVLHELGHYIAAKKVGFKNIKLVLVKWKGIPIKIAVTGEFNLESKTDSEIINWHLDANHFMASGSMLSIVGILGFYLLGIFSMEFSFITVLFFSLYMFYELTDSKSLCATNES